MTYLQWKLWQPHSCVIGSYIATFAVKPRSCVRHHNHDVTICLINLKEPKEESVWYFRISPYFQNTFGSRIRLCGFRALILLSQNYSGVTAYQISRYLLTVMYCIFVKRFCVLHSEEFLQHFGCTKDNSVVCKL